MKVYLRKLSCVSFILSGDHSDFLFAQCAFCVECDYEWESNLVYSVPLHRRKSFLSTQDQGCEETNYKYSRYCN